ncbi:ProQ/FINO family protein [Pantoea stewartii]|uniref:ProQ/FINO family protein n=1 Tax=Pantoea stewartii TaxID=66269 RepID=UPI001CF7C4BF
MKVYTCSYLYQLVLSTMTVRISLDGQPAGEVSPEKKTLSRQQTRRTEAKMRAREKPGNGRLRARKRRNRPGVLLMHSYADAPESPYAFLRGFQGESRGLRCRAEKRAEGVSGGEVK